MKIIILLISIFTLSACGGGSGGSSNNPSPPTGTTPPSTLTGTLMGGTFAGFRYRTESQSGNTNSNGEFSYESGENIEFFIGDYQVGEKVAVKSDITILDLFPDNKFPLNTYDLNLFLRKEKFGRYGDDSLLDEQFQLINFVTLVYSLDKDKNPANGIELPDGIGSVFSNAVFNLNQTPKDFKNDSIFINFQYESFGANVFDSARIILYWRALDSMIDAANLSLSIPSLISREYDNDANGTVNSITTYQYNQSGLKTGEVFDNDNDGTPNSENNFNFNQFGQLELLEKDFAADGTINQINKLEYDIHGNRTYSAYDSNGDGNNDHVTRYQYDSLGKLISRQTDTNDDGTINLVVSYNYQNGLLTTQETDSDNDGNVDSITTYEYSNGLLVKKSSDTDADGTENSVIVYTYDSFGNLIKEEQDYNADNVIDVITTQNYDVNNFITYRGVDFDADGNDDEFSEYTRNEAGQVISQMESSAIYARIDYTYDSDGFILTTTQDESIDGIIDETTTFTYDQDKNLISVEINATGGMAGISHTIRAQKYEAGKFISLYTQPINR